MDEDRDLLTALSRYEAGLCRGCGIHKDVAMNEAYDGSPGADGKFVTGLPWTCFPCESLGKAQAAYQKSLPEGHNHGQFQWGTQLVLAKSNPPFQPAT